MFAFTVSFAVSNSTAPPKTGKHDATTRQETHINTSGQIENWTNTICYLLCVLCRPKDPRDVTAGIDTWLVCALCSTMRNVKCKRGSRKFYWPLSWLIGDGCVSTSISGRFSNWDSTESFWAFPPSTRLMLRRVRVVSCVYDTMPPNENHFEITFHFRTIALWAPYISNITSNISHTNPGKHSPSCALGLCSPSCRTCRKIHFHNIVWQNKDHNLLIHFYWFRASKLCRTAKPNAATRRNFPHCPHRAAANKPNLRPRTREKETASFTRCVQAFWGSIRYIGAIHMRSSISLIYTHTI